MIISHKYKFIFIHVPKTGGTSISDALKESCSLVYPARILTENEINKFGIDGKFEGTWSHHLPAEQLKKVVGEQKWNTYFKFGFIRNPFDLLVSEYFFMKEKKIDGREPKDFIHLYNMVLQTADFHSYLLKRYKNKPSINLFNTIMDCNNLPAVNFIGRFESLDRDFRKILRIIGIKAELKKLNDSVHEHYSKYYSDEAKSLVSRICSHDLKRFNYKFEITE